MQAAHRESLRPEALERLLWRVAGDVRTSTCDRALEPEASSRERPFIPEIVGNDFRDVAAPAQGCAGAGASGKGPRTQVRVAHRQNIVGMAHSYGELRMAGSSSSYGEVRMAGSSSCGEVRR